MDVTVDGVSLSVQDEGVGEPVLLLHGFPDSSQLWRNQVGPLVRAGRRVIVPDLRGFGASDRPADVAAYRLPVVLRDVVAVLDRAGVGRVDVVGHDMGADLGWVLAATMPERVRRLAVLSVGHPAAFFAAGMLQREKSWYVLYFQFRGVAEEGLTRDGWRLFREWVAGAVDTERYVRDLSRPGALTAALNWYRADSPVAGFAGQARSLPPVRCPTLGMWGAQDFALTEGQLTGSAAHVQGEWRYERIEDAGHWLPLDAPDKVTALLLDHLQR